MGKSKSGTDELLAFRSWVKALTLEQLLNALHCDLTNDKDGQDYGILHQLISSQAPPSTPIHPQAMGYRPWATSHGANDGRDEECRVLRDRFTRPRLFQLLLRGSKRIPRKSTRQFEIICRKFQTPDGEILGLGSTQEQRDADEHIMRGTYFHKDVRCWFQPPNDNAKPIFILRMLHLVSRGQFLQKKFPISSKDCCENSFIAPWLLPTERWFSLPMYLASRYEIALWSAFRGSRTPFLSSSTFMNFKEKWNQDIKDYNLQKATLLTLRNHILSQDRERFPLVLDGMIYTLLNQQSLNSSFPPASLDSTPLLDIGRVRSNFRCLLYGTLEEEYALRFQEELLASEHIDNNENTFAKTKHIRKHNKSRRKKKKKPSIPSVCNIPLCDEEYESIEDECAKENFVDSHIPYLDNPTPSIERTRKVLLVLSLLEGVVEKVFDQVGLSPKVTDQMSQNVVNNAQDPSNALNNNPNSLQSFGEKIETTKEHIPSNPFLNSSKNPASSIHPDFQNFRNSLFSFLNNDADEAIKDILPRELEFPVFSQHGPLDIPWIYDDDHSTSFMGYRTREKSIFADFFRNDEIAESSEKKDLLASSTAASIASSTDKEPGSVDDADGISDVSSQDSDCTSEKIAPPTEEQLIELISTSVTDVELNSKCNLSSELERHDGNEKRHEALLIEVDNLKNLDESRYPSPPAPRTPSPQLSPILVSLADLKDIRERVPILAAAQGRGFLANKISSSFAGSLPSSPVQNSSKTLSPHRTHDDLRIKSSLDTPLGTKDGCRVVTQRRVDALISYRNAMVRPYTKSLCGWKDDNENEAVKHGSFNFTKSLCNPILDPNAPRKEVYNCAYSDIAGDNHGDDDRSQQLPKERSDFQNLSTTKDELTSISVVSQREPEEVAALRDERNTFRDMCLTLGAEVAKLKNMLAAQKGIYMEHYGREYLAAHTSYNSEFLKSDFHCITKARTIGPTSDIGIPRGDHDSAAQSEDGTDHLVNDRSEKPRFVHVRQASSGNTVFGSDVSVDQNINAMPNISSFIPPIGVDLGESELGSGFHSRLSKDIIKFLNANRLRLQKTESFRATAVHRLSKLVTALWPRAQVKLYGSYINGLSIPSSDLDFVICLPAVHKNALAITPGALEGRNAINESSQKLLARKLKGESWIDTRSIKLVERTIVPVIKVATKDTRARTIQLDISFDGPVHHGLEAIEMTNDILKQYPMVRPLLLVLKQFLLHRGLSTAYTGGLSSYCLFLMITRYLQEQSSSWGDCGSLLMGFLDFFGNSFDPRATGISVGRRLYFARMGPHIPYQPSVIPVSTPPVQQSSIGKNDLLHRRHSFTEKGNSEPASSRPPRYQPPASPRFPAPAISENTDLAARKSYTFDPLWVEDPLSAGNNVGRNAFRIFQVQRAFSDAHRALVANLEWENTSNMHHEVAEYPLLQCLLQSEDVMYDLDDFNR
jgi:Nucleotidyltransferase domain